ncbi:MAG: hypothetical protein JSW72_05675 [Candidatus Bathyarchaeota archaeon]|nr:MAG: hypothetical protein JSW72_05675 [Candidatus Bathyarchaeota archaeon]
MDVKLKKTEQIQVATITRVGPYGPEAPSRVRITMEDLLMQRCFNTPKKTAILPQRAQQNSLRRGVVTFSAYAQAVGDSYV